MRHLYGFFSPCKIGPHLAEIADHFAEAHICHVAAVNQRSLSCDGRHLVAADKCHDSIGILRAQFLYQAAAVEVAGRFSGYDEIVHCLFVSFSVKKVDHQRAAFIFQNAVHHFCPRMERRASFPQYGFISSFWIGSPDDDT